MLDQCTLAESATERQKLIALARQIAQEGRQLVTIEQEKIKKRRKQPRVGWLSLILLGLVYFRLD